MSRLLVPEHIARARTPVPERQKHVTNTDDFVTPQQIAEQIALFRSYEGSIPAPTGWALMVLMVAMPEETEGGMILEDMYREQKSKASPQGIVVGLGDTAYNPHDARFPTGAWCKRGDRVLFGRYSGKTFTLANGQELAFLVDTDIIAVVESGWLTEGGDDVPTTEQV